MDENLGANDPYRTMSSGEDSITPDFLKKNNGESAGKALAAAEQAAQLVMAAKGGKMPSGGTGGSGGAGGAGMVGSGAGAGGAKGAAQDGLKSGAEKAENAESSPKGLYNKKGQNDKDDEPQLKMSKGMKAALKSGLMAAAPFLLIFLLIGGFILLIVGLPVMMIGAIDYNLQRALGFFETVGILEEQGEHVTAELAASGKMPKDYFNDLVANGIDVGQVTANGDFVRTDTYIANIENRDDLIASAGGFSYIGDNDGELAMLFDGKVIYADDFVAEVESNPRFYAAYSNAADIGTKYYYSQDVEKVYQDMGISRGAFNDWESTGDYEEDEKSFFSILDKILNAKSLLTVGGAGKDGADGDNREGGASFTQPISGAAERATEVAGDIVRSVANQTKEYLFDRLPHECTEEEKEMGLGSRTGYCFGALTDAAGTVNATKRAVGALNAAISSGEPFLASLVFMAIEEPLQRARVDGDGPVNIVMNALTNTDGKLVKYRDVATGEEKESGDSILQTDNFRAAVSDSDYSKEEAMNFGRDRILKSTEQSGTDTVRSTTLSTNGKAESTAVMANGLGASADAAVVSKASDAIALGAIENNSDVFQSVVGGNRAIEGGSFISNTVNMQMIGAMPSNDQKISEYHQEVEEVMARKAEAERATKNPFDVTSPNTFLGSIVHNIATAVIKNYGSGATVLSAMNSAADTTGKAVASLMGSAVADGSDDDFTTMSGEGCDTVGSVGVEGDLYCTSHNTPSTKYMNYTKSDWQSLIDDNGFEEFVVLGMKRYATVGVKNAEICERYKENHPRSSIGKIWDKFKSMVGVYDSCEDVEDDVATGGKYTFGSHVGDYQNSQNELYSGYALYEEVRSLLTGEQSAVAVVWDKYTEEHPLDNSRAGVIARISGMEKYDAEMAIAYAGYLNEIAMYNPSERFDFTAPVVLIERPILEYHSDEVAVELYAWYSKQTEYEDLRTRNFVV